MCMCMHVRKHTELLGIMDASLVACQPCFLRAKALFTSKTYRPQADLEANKKPERKPFGHQMNSFKEQISLVENEGIFFHSQPVK